MKKIIVAIDGFSSCGKSTIAKTLAKRAGYKYIDTGAMYRAVGLYVKRHVSKPVEEVKPQDVVCFLPEIKVSFAVNDNGKSETLLNGENVEGEIRTLDIAKWASVVSTIKEVRAEMVEQQRKMGQEGGIVMDGRDIGTVVFPNADLKLFVTARPEIRAQRRYAELIEKGEKGITLENVMKDTEERDYRDTHRAESPLRKAEDAVELDNSDMSVEEEHEWVWNIFLKFAQ